MNREETRTTLREKMRANLSLIAGLMLLLPCIVLSQVPVDEYGVPVASLDGDADDPATYAGDSASESPTLSAAELEVLVGPVALYPDDLLAIVLPASTYPLEIVQAARFLEQLESDASLKPDESWDESVTALLNYPEVVRLMDEDIDWTWRLGEAVIAQQEQLIAAIENFRDRAYAAGNLKTDEHQKVNSDDGIIEIVPVDDEIIYVPYYEPAEVVVYQPRRVYYYYPRAYPVYYYPYPAGYRFSSGFFWGVTTVFTIGWHNDYLHVYHPTYWGHPYYGHQYYSHYYRRPSINVYNTWYVDNSRRSSTHRYRDGDYWRPRYRSGARPYEQQVRNYHYPTSDRQDSRRNDTGRTRQVRESGRMDLELRERNRDAIDRTRASARRGDVTVNGAGLQTHPTGNTPRSSNDRTQSSRTTRDRVPGTQEQNRNRSNRSQASDEIATHFRERNSASGTVANANSRRSAGTDQQRRVPANSASRSSVAQSVNLQRETASVNAATRRAAAERNAVQRQRTPAATTTVARTPAPRAAATRERSTPRQAAQHSPSRDETAGTERRTPADARTSNGDRKRRK
jgi:hypothetical protein